MTFDEILEQVITLLKRQGRVSYPALKIRFSLEDDYLEALKTELLYVHPVIDDEGRGLIWTGDAASAPTPALSASVSASPPTTEQERDPVSYTPPHLAEKILTSKTALEGCQQASTACRVSI